VAGRDETHPPDLPYLPYPTYPALKIDAEFVTSAADARGLPNDALPEVALVGRSNVGKSSLINALVRQRVARTSAAPGKTRLANVYRVARGGSAPFYMVDLPGYGYARGGTESRHAFDELTRSYFGRGGQVSQVDLPAAVLVVDSRHPGLESDVQAWRWLAAAVERRAVVATKVDKLARGQRIRAMRELESVFEAPVLPVSAGTGEGLDELWKLIDRLANSRTRNHRSSRLPRATAPHLPKR
jgi:GTP-binding protein